MKRFYQTGFFILLLVAPATAPARGQTAPPPRIFVNGTDVTGGTATVIAGEKVAFTSDGPNAFGFWNLGPTAVAGAVFDNAPACPTFPASAATSCARYIPLNPNQTAVDAYYLYGNSYPISFASDRGVSRATITVQAPTAVQVDSAFGLAQYVIDLVTDDADGDTTRMSFGQKLDCDGLGVCGRAGTGSLYDPGIDLGASSGGVSRKGRYSWVQTIDFNRLTRWDGTKLGQCDLGLGLDSSYPYGAMYNGRLPFGLAGIKNSRMEDSPAVSIPDRPKPKAFHIWGKQQSFSATLLWTSRKPSSIPVPLWYLKWGMVLNGSQYNVATKTWEVTGFGSTSLSQAATEANRTYEPSWKSVIKSNVRVSLQKLCPSLF